MSPYDKITLFKDKLLEEFKDEIQCIILTGSYSRGEQTIDSDVDIWIFFDKITFEHVKKVGDILSGFDSQLKINPQCTTVEEGLKDYFAREYSPIQYTTDGIILFGSFPEISMSKDTFLRQSKSLSAYVIMGIRHYVSTNEEEDALIKRKLKKRILKPTMWAIRFKYAGLIGVYYKSLDDIKEVCTNEELEVINIFQDFLCGKKNDYYNKTEMIFDKVYKICEKNMV